MIGSPKNIRKKIIPENAFEHKKKKPGLSANRPWNDSAQEFFPSTYCSWETSRIAVNGEFKSDVYGKRKTSDKLRSSQNRKWADKNSSKQFSWIKLGAWIYWFPGGYNESRQRINLFTWYLAERDLSHVYGIRDTFFAKFDGQTARTWRKFLAALLDTSQFLQFSRLFSKSILRLLAFASESRKNFPLALRAREKFWARLKGTSTTSLAVSTIQEPRFCWPNYWLTPYMLYSQKSFLFQSYSLHWPPPGGGGTCVNFFWLCAPGFSDPLPHYSPVANYRPHLSHFWANI